MGSLSPPKMMYHCADQSIWTYIVSHDTMSGCYVDVLRAQCPGSYTLMSA